MTSAFDAWVLSLPPGVAAHPKAAWNAGRAPLLAVIEAHNANCKAACGQPRVLCDRYATMGRRCPNCPMDDVIDVEGM